jgi:hypothetical protein
MILRTRYGQDFNPDKVWAVEWGFESETRNGEKYIYWSVWNKYTTQRRMLQGLKDLKYNDDSYSRVSNDGGKTYKIRKYYYRPVHINYDYELKNLCDKSLREYKLKQLLEKN